MKKQTKKEIIESEIMINNSEDGKFEDLSEKEKAEVYVHIYTKLNGAIEISKVIDIIEKEHNIKLTKEDITKIVKESEIISEKDIYLYMNELGEENIKNLIIAKTISNNYKIIDDIDVIIEDFFKTTDQLIEICFKYELNEEILAEIERLIHIGNFNSKMLKIILKLSGIEMSSKRQENLYKELDQVQQEARVWILNGYNKDELEN